MSDTGLLFNADFDNGSAITSMGFKYSGNPSSIVTMDGERGVKLTLDHYGSNSYKYRTEIQPNKLPSSDFTSGMFAKMGGEFWYGVSTYMPDSWSQVDRSDTIITQWHAQPDSGNPPVALQTKYVNGEQHYNLIIRSHPSADGTSGFKYIQQFDLGKIDGDIGEWVDWAWHIKWSPTGDGFLELYKDGKKVVDFDGGTCYVDDAGPYLKIGLYKYDWHSSTDTGPDSRTIYVDNIRVGDESASLATVSPQDSSTPTEPDTGTGGTPTSPPPSGTPTSIVGTTGDDMLSGTSGADSIDGGAGTDFLDLSKATTGWKVDLAAGKADGGGTNVDTIKNIENVIGSTASDEMLGDAGANKLRGMDGNDLIDGRAGDDVLAGGAGSDTVYGGQGADLMYGGTEGDLLYGGAGDDTVFADEGDDTVLAGAGTDTVTLGAGRDTIVVEGLGMGTDRVTDFAAGEDVIDLTALHASLVASGAKFGADYVRFVANGAATEVVVTANGVSETVLVLDNVAPGALAVGTNVIAPEPPQPKAIVGTAGDDKMVGTDGADTIDGAGGTDFLDLSASTTGWKVDLAAGKADGGGTNVDTVVNIESVIGSTASDELLGDAGANKLRGMDGNDLLDGRAGDDVLAGGAGSDTVFGGQGADLMYGGTEGDLLYGGAGDDTVFADEGDDTVLAGAGTDTLTLGAGRDTIVVEGLGMGTDRVTDFAAGEDMIDLTALHASLVASGAKFGADYVRFVANGAATEVVVTANGVSETVLVLDNVAPGALAVGTNVVAPPPPGPLPIVGTAGDDKMVGTSDADVIDGGAGIDFLDLSAEAAGWKVDLAAGTADGGGENVDALTSIENVIGSDFADQMFGDEGANKLRGLKGDDVIYGRGGDDVLAGGAGSDQVYGGAGADLMYGGLDGDKLFGGLGSDTLYGDEGNDVVDGGGGADVLLGGAGDDTMTGGLDLTTGGAVDVMTGGTGADTFVVERLGNGADRVTDFSAVEDKVDLRALTAGLKAAIGDELPDDFLAFVQVGAATEVRIDVDGAAGAMGGETVLVLDNTLASDLQVGHNVYVDDFVHTETPVI